jgi:hypothetical protein
MPAVKPCAAFRGEEERPRTRWLSAKSVLISTVVVPLLACMAYEGWNMTVHLRYRTSPPDPLVTMRAVTYSRHGTAADVLEVSEVPAPLMKAEPGMIVIRVAAASLNPVDFKMFRSDQPAALIPKPFIPGYDVAGTVASAGAGSGFTVGDAVFGMLPLVGHTWGSLAECVGGRFSKPWLGCASLLSSAGAHSRRYVAGEASLFAHAPKSIPLVEAAALPLVGLTVLQVRGTGHARTFWRADLRERRVDPTAGARDWVR